MAYIQRFGGSLVLGLATIIGAVAQASARPQVPGTVAVSTDSRLAGDWQSGATTLPASKPPLPQPARDLGPAPSGERLDRMLLLLEPSAAQRQALDAELESQQDPGSPEYHHWLKPTDFAGLYANAATDAAAVVSWLQSEGFQVAAVPGGRGWIEFTGTVAQVEQAFQAPVHSFHTPSGVRVALAGPVVVPSALRPVIHGIVSLDGVVSSAAITTPKPVGSAAADLAATTSPAEAEALTPRILNQILHADTLSSEGWTGAGQTIAIAARSNVNVRDVAAFRKTFGLSEEPLQVAVNGMDPGTGVDEAQAVLAASWAGAAAPQARIVLVPAASTSATDGVDLSLAAIVNGAEAHTVAVGFSACEASMSEAHAAFYAALYRQAAAQGMAVIAASGDSGASACHAAGSDAAVTTGYGVNALASTPWNTAVGAAAWSGSGSSTAELSAWAPVSSADPAYAGGGGSSALYASPAWQPLPSENRDLSASPGDHFRLLPDLALPTALDTASSHGLAFCLSGAATVSSNPGGCTLMRAGGSSAAAAVFAGIAALIAEKNGAQGNLAPRLYDLSRRNGIFDDVEQGSAQLACATASPGCGATGLIGFTAGPGYDRATGLGSVNAERLISVWAMPDATGTSAVTVNTPTVSPVVANTTYNPSAALTFSTKVVSGTGGATPTGTVTFLNNTTGASLGPSPSTVDANGMATLSIAGGLSTGGNDIVAVYSGDSTYKSVTSQPLVVTVEPSTTTLTVVPGTSTPTAGSPFTVTVDVGVGIPPQGSAPPTGKITLNVDGLPTYTASLTTTAGVTTATFPAVSITAAGAHPLQATYVGDANYDASTSAAVTVTITKGATVTALSATPATLTAGTAETFTATISPVNVASGATYSITGTVSFYDGTTLLGTAVVNANAATLGNITLSAAVLHTITAVYSGDTSWAASTSNAIALQSVLLPDTVTLSVNINTTAPGQVVTLLATVTPIGIPATNTEQNPTGNVIFYDGTTVLGTVALGASLNYSSTATLLTGALPGGQNVLTAVYVGDLYYAPGTSNPVTIDVQDFSITPSSSNPPTNLTIVKGSSGSASFVVTGLGGFNNQIQVVCAVPTQDDMTCTASPQQVTPTGTVTFTVQTYAAGGTTTSARRGPGQVWPRAAGEAALAVLVFFVLPFGRRARIFASKEGVNRAQRWMTLLLLLAGAAGAGMGCSSSVQLAQNGGTPLGVATLTVTAGSYVNNTVVSHSVYLTVNVVAPGTASSVQSTVIGK